MSSTLTTLPTRVQTGSASGASSSQWLRPHLIGLEVAPGHVAQAGRIDQGGHSVPELGEHHPEAGVKQQRLLIPHQKVVELQVQLRHMDREPEQIGSDLGDGGHGWG
jgi:hypothetical protein